MTADKQLKRGKELSKKHTETEADRLLIEHWRTWLQVHFAKDDCKYLQEKHGGNNSETQVKKHKTMACHGTLKDATCTLQKNDDT